MAHIPNVEGETKYQLACTAALAESASLRQAMWPEISHQTIGNIAEILGRTPPSLDAGFEALQERIRCDPESDLHRIIPLLHHFEVQREYLFEPVKALADYACNYPLQRLWN